MNTTKTASASYSQIFYSRKKLGAREVEEIAEKAVLKGLVTLGYDDVDDVNVVVHTETAIEADSQGLYAYILRIYIVITEYIEEQFDLELLLE